jgi:signal recognition particle subunit SEC65
MYQPFIFKLESGKSDILDKEPSPNDLVLSSTINMPLSSLGFIAYLHRTKNSMSITKNLPTKNKFYYVINPFEHEIMNYEDSIKNLTKIYLGIKDDTPEIMSRSFYKMWEILFLFGIADKKEMTYAAMADSPAAFIQAVINYREKLGPGITKDKIFGVAIQSEKNKYLEMGEQFIGFYNRINPGLIHVRENVATKSGKHKGKENITQIKTISLFKKDIQKSKTFADLVTADGSLDWDNDNFQEQEAYQLILGEIVAALRVQAKSGNFVIKIFETFTIPSIKLLYLLSSFYEETYVYKPFFSRPSNSEKYVICKGFKYDQSKDSTLLNKKIKSLESVLENMNSLKYVFDIFPDLNMPSEWIERFKFYNIKIANPQQIMINQIVTYIKENNYFGEKYHMFRDGQIEASKWWVNNFFPPSNNIFIKNKEDLDKLLKSSMEKYNMEETKFLGVLVK